MLRARGHRIRYVNFARDPDACPRLERYQALIVLGGPMQVGDHHHHPHLLTECRLIEQALHDGLPVLGICLGAQLLAHVLAARVAKCDHPEIGWYQLRPTPHTSADPLLGGLGVPHPIFQWHHWGFDCPAGSASIADSVESGCQAFRVEDHAWGFQFHLELDERLIRRWLTLPFYRDDLAASGLKKTPADIAVETARHLPDTLRLADEVFTNWLNQLDSPEQRVVLASR